MSTVLVTSRSFSSGDLDLVARLAEAGHDLVRGPADHDLAALRDVLARADAWIAGTGPVAAAHLQAAPALQVVARYGVGYDAVDLTAAAEAGVLVTNTPGANSGAVADHAMALILAILRRLADGDRRVRRGDWSVTRGRELGALTVGIIGFGRIGQGVAQRLGGFGSEVVVHDPFLTDRAAADLGVTTLDLPAIAAAADVVTLHAPGGEQIVDQDWLAHANPGQIVVNTARADLVDESAIAQALRDGSLSGFAADTLATESAAGASPLLAEDLIDRVLITPHLGAQTVQAIDLMGSMAVDDVLAVLSGTTPSHQIDLKEN